jgi:serine/threonine-protein kinase
LLGVHQLEGHYGLRPVLENETAVVDTMYSWFTMALGNQLGLAVGGRSLARFGADAERRVQISAEGQRGKDSFFPVDRTADAVVAGALSVRAETSRSQSPIGGSLIMEMTARGPGFPLADTALAASGKIDSDSPVPPSSSDSPPAPSAHPSPPPPSVDPASPSVGPGADNGAVKETQWRASPLEGGEPSHPIVLASPRAIMRPSSHLTDPMINKLIGEKNRYQVIGLLGEGGMGKVYRCADLKTNQVVAVKVLNADLSQDTHVLKRFEQEIRAITSLKNPHIIKVTDFGQLPNDAPFFVMEWLEGESLGQILERENRSLSMPRVLDIAWQLANGLVAAHSKRIVHRDLKPDNIFLTAMDTGSPHVVILDFGIAKIAEPRGDSKLTQDGTLFGTPMYMSPEQVSPGKTIDLRSDMYSYGIILYEMASGRTPFKDEDVTRVLQMQLSSPVPPLPDEVPTEFANFVYKLLAKDPADRFQSMGEVKAVLAKLKTGVQPVFEVRMSTPSGSLFPDSGVRKKHPYALHAIGLGAALALGIGLVVSTKPWSSDPDSTLRPTPGEVPVPKPRPPENVPPPAPVIVQKTRVTLTVTPKNARVYQGDENINIKETGQIQIEVEAGKPVELRVIRTGFKPQTVKLDGSQEAREVNLQHGSSSKSRPKNGASAAPTPAASPAPTPRPKSSGGSNVIELWK